MRTFDVTVNGKTFQVQVEETTGEIQSAKPVPDQVPVKPSEPISAPPPPPVEQPKPVVSVPLDAVGEPITAPMPGVIVSTSVSAGQTVKKYDVLCVLEAMKMENEIVATASGTIKEVRVKSGDLVNTGDPMIIIG